MDSITTICPSCGARQSGKTSCSICGFDYSLHIEPGLAPVQTQSGEIKLFCLSCGTRVVPAAKFCVNCGVSLVHGATEPSRVIATSRGQSKTFLIAGLAVVFIVGGIALINTLTQETPAVSKPAQPATGAETQQAPAKIVSEDQLKAIEEFKKNVADNPNDTTALLHLANTLYDVENFKDAIAYYAQYLKINPKNADVRTDYAFSLFRAGDNEQSIREMIAVTKISPKHQRAHFILAIIYFTMGQMESGAEWLNKCIAMDSTSTVGREAVNLRSNHSQWLHK